jgi:prepilin-type N-terminal cleavage/methylation domain-containing protein
MKSRHTAHPKKDTRQGGFTLIEVMIAMALFAVAITGSLAMYTRSVDNNKTTFISTRMLNMAYEQMDTLMELPYDDLQLQVGTQPAGGPVSFQWPDLNVYGEMQWTVLPEGGSIRNCKLVALTIFWTRGGEYTRGPYTLTFLKPELL